MSIELKQTSFFLGMWYFDLPESTFFMKNGSKGGNFMGALFRESEDGPWKFRYRFRYYRGDNPHLPFNDPDDPNTSVDEFSWYECIAPDRHAGTAIAKIHNLVHRLCRLAGTESDFLPLGDYGDGAHLKMRVANKPWLHVRTMQEISEDHFAQ